MLCRKVETTLELLYVQGSVNELRKTKSLEILAMFC